MGVVVVYLIIFSEVPLPELASDRLHYLAPSLLASLLPSFLPSTSLLSSIFVSNHGLQLNVAQHVLINALLKEGFETKLVVTKASCRSALSREFV